METVRGFIYAKAGSGLAFATQKGFWFNIPESLRAVLTTLNKGDAIIVEYTKQGVTNIVSSIVRDNGQPAQQQPPQTQAPAAYVPGTCEVCGKPVKGNFKKCFTCNKFNKEAPQQAQPTQATPAPQPTQAAQPKTEEPKKTYQSYNNPERDAMIRRGNSLNASAAVLSGAMCIVDKSPEEIAAITKTVALIFEQFLDR